MTFTQIGALVGFLTGLFVLIDRFVSGRPYPLLTKRSDHLGPGLRVLECINTARCPILLTVRTNTRAVLIMRDHSTESAYDATAGLPVNVLLNAGQSAAFPIVVLNGRLLDEGAPRTPFLIIISWRKTSSMWLPQVPVFRISSVRALRTIDHTKFAGPPAD